MAIITNFLDESVQCNKEQIEYIIWGNDNVTHHFKTLKRTYEVNSFGRISFSKNNASKSEVYGPFTIPIAISKEKSCRPEIWALLAMELAKKEGVDFKDFDHLIFILPASIKMQSKLCGWNGLGHLGCLFQCKAWVSNCDSLGVYVHEIGHNLGLQHSASYNPLTDEYAEYGDPTAIMSNRWFHSKNEVFYFNAPHRIEKGWIEKEHILDVDSSGIYKIMPFNKPPIDGKYQVLRIKTQESKHSYSHYVFSFAVGENVIFNNSCLIHKHVNAKSSTKYLSRLSLDGKRVWRDTSNIFSVRLIDINSEEMSLNITFDCIKSDFLVNVLSPSLNRLQPWNTFEKLSSDSNTQYIYLNRKRDSKVKLEITNQDSESCHPIILKHEIKHFNDWKLMCTPSDLYLAPQQTCIIECDIKSSKSKNNSPSYEFDILLKESPNLISNSSREFNLSLILLMDDVCWRNDIDLIVPNSFESTISGQINSNITLINNDSISCRSRKLNINIFFKRDDEIVYIKRDLVLNINPQNKKNITVSTSVPSKLGLWDMVFNISDLTNIEESETLKYVEKKIPTTIYKNCIRSKFNIIHPTEAKINARNGTRIIFTIENKDRKMCPPDNVNIRLSSNSNPNVQLSFFPTQLLNFSSGDIQEIYFTASLSNHIPSVEEALVEIEIEGEKYHTKQTHTIQLELQPVLCEYNEPIISIHCPHHVGVPLDNTMGYFRCQIYLKNTNTWPCSTSQFILSSNLLIQTFDDRIIEKEIFNESLEINNDELLPNNHTWISMHVVYDKKVLDYIHEKPISLNISASLNDTLRPDLHMNVSSITQIGICRMEDPQLYFDNNITETEMFSGSSKTFALNFIAGHNKYCNASSYNIAITNNHRHIKISLSTKIFDRDRKRTLLHITVDPLASGPYSISITAVNSVNSSRTATISFTINVDQSCIIRPPSIISKKKYYRIIQGEEKNLIMPVSIINNDQEGCFPSSLKVKIINTHKFINTTSNDDMIFELNPSESIDFNVLISISRYLEPGNYSIKVEISDKLEISHLREALIPLEVQCPYPRPVHDIKIKEVKSRLGTSVRVHLSWESCVVPLDCCCPCTWEIWNNDKLIGKTNYRNFTYVPALSEAGMNNNFTIHVIDRLGQRSNINTCGYSILKFVSSSPFDFLLVIICIFMVLTIPTITLIIEYRRNSYKIVKKMILNS